MMTKTCILLALFAMDLQQLATGQSIRVNVDPAATFLRTDTANDPLASSAVPIDLAANGISPGQLIRLERLGDFVFQTATDLSDDMIGVFSSNDTLLTSDASHRVPGAIEAGTEFVTLPTFPAGLLTDIPEDFRITDIQLLVPAGASHLFVAAHDSKYGDNTDPGSSDFGVRITVVPEPCTGLLGLLTVMIAAGFRWGRSGIL